MRINLILPFPATKPVGGAKIMYEYANRLRERGHDVAVYHSIRRPFKKSSTPVWLKQLIFSLRGVARPKWFPLHKDIRSVIVPEITDKHIRNADVTLSTWWQMAYAVSELPASRGAKFNLIQGFETWGGQEDKVLASYRLPLHHLVIARYLYEIFEEKTGGTKPVHLPLAIDEKRFSLDIPIQERKNGSIIMLYSTEEVKGSQYGLDALKKVREACPQISVQLFGVSPEPEGLPSWISYAQRPGNLNELYNRASIFISPSLSEGWALPPAEAMACGCAVVCTKIGGHLDYAIENETAILAEARDADSLASGIIRLINDDNERQRLATKGRQLISQGFSWEKSVSQLEDCFRKAIEK